MVPVTHVLFDFDMAGRDKCFDFVGSAGIRSVLETALGLRAKIKELLETKLLRMKCLRKTLVVLCKREKDQALARIIEKASP